MEQRKPENTKQLALPQSTVTLIETLKTHDIADLIVAENGISISICLEAKTVNEVKKSISEKDLLKLVSFMITTCIANFNVTTKPSQDQQEAQIYTMANDFIGKYKSESLEDFALCFKKARTAELGTTFNRIDSETLFGFMRKHLEAKAEERERGHYMLKHPKIERDLVVPGIPKDPEYKKDYEAVQEIARKLRTGNYRSVKDIFPKAELPTHEKFLESMKGRMKMMDEKELAETLKQAASGKLYDVIKLIEEEKERRKS